MQYWVLKAKPYYYESGALRTGNEDDWERVTAYYGLKIGDRVFLWASSPQKRVVGLGVVVREAGAKMLRVKYLTELLKEPPGIGSLKENAKLSTTPFLLPRHGTVFDLTPEQGEELYRIVLRSNPESDVWGKISEPLQIEDIEAEALEGSPYFATHLRRERNQGLSKKRKERFIQDHGVLFCEICGRTHENYGELSGDIFEVHHRLPLSEAIGPVTTRLQDLAVLCPNCHRAIHRTSPMLTAQALTNRLTKHSRLSPRARGAL